MQGHILNKSKYILVTIHRAENVDDDERLRRITEAILKISEKYKVMWPLHPRTSKRMTEMGLLRKLNGNIELLQPVGYIDMLTLEKNAQAIITDSGGVQKEAFFHKVPCITLRNETEWMELVTAKWNSLAPPDGTVNIAEVVFNAVNSQGNKVTPYGNGDAGDKIVKKLMEDFGLGA